MSFVPFGMAGLAEAAAGQALAIALLALTAASVVLVSGCVFRSVRVTQAAVGFCLLLATSCGPAAFAAPPDTDDPDEHSWHEADKSVGWHALGLAVASVGCLGLVCSGAFGTAAPSVACAEGASQRSTTVRSAVRWGLIAACGVLVLAGGAVMATNSPPACFWFLAVLGVVMAATVHRPEQQA